MPRRKPAPWEELITLLARVDTNGGFDGSENPEHASEETS